MYQQLFITFCDTFYSLYFKSLCKTYKSIFLKLDIELNQQNDSEKLAKLAGTKLFFITYWFLEKGIQFTKAGTEKRIYSGEK
jgi:hypothetical protein